MARAIGPDIGAAGHAVDFGRDRDQHLFDVLVRTTRAARHDAGAAQRSLLSPGHPGSDEPESGLGGSRRATARVMEERVAAIDDRVARLEQVSQRWDRIIDARAGLHHEKNRARRFEDPDHLSQRAAGAEVAFASVLRHELVGALFGAVVNHHPHAVRCQVACQVLTHSGQADHAQLTRCDSAHPTALSGLHSCAPCTTTTASSTSKPPITWTTDRRSPSMTTASITVTTGSQVLRRAARDAPTRGKPPRKSVMASMVGSSARATTTAQPPRLWGGVSSLVTRAIVPKPIAAPNMITALAASAGAEPITRSPTRM